MNKAEANYKLRKIYKLLKTHKVVVGFDRELDGWGEMQIEGHKSIRITLHPKRRELPQTIIHELLHKCYPEIDDDSVFLAWEDEMFELLSDQQLSNLMLRLYGSATGN